MALASGISKRYKNLFILDEDGLRRIEGVLVKAASTYPEPLTVTYHVRREDDRFYETHNIDEVLTDPNVSGRRIKLLGIELRKTSSLTDQKDDDTNPIAWVVFNKDEPPFEVPDVRVRISCSDKTWALMLADELEPQLTRLFKVKKFPSWVFILFTPIITLVAYRASSWLGFEDKEAITHAKLTAIFYILAILVFYLHYRTSERKIRALSITASEPVFLWGEEISAFIDREAIKKNIFWVLIVGFIVSFIAGAITLLL